MAKGNEAVYETLPFVDGNRYSGGAAQVGYGDIVVALTESSLTIRCPRDFAVENRIGRDGNHLPDVLSVTDKALCLSYRGTEYTVRAVAGRFASERRWESEDGALTLHFE